ncbi:7587_t:CDS:10 [Scutellospora calospora]|uniref:7587_t:CDS:1 n=1 Tax=Scutellospora calospora TaxID=85575 RepID=A0ACA9LAW9_9GLOM|nr:7587_t:CDS:10 [Scutellospora calospora]
MSNKFFIFKPPLTPETFNNGNGSFAKTSYAMHFKKPFYKRNLSSKKVQQESQVDVVPSNQDLQNSDSGFNKTGGFFTTIKSIEESNKNVENQDSRIFYNKYSYITAVYKTKKDIAYQIPDEYEIETNLLQLSIRCKTKYQQTDPYSNSIVSSSSMISANNAGTKFLMDICSKQNSHISGVFLFGFDIDCLHKARIKTPENRKCSYTELKSDSQKNKRIALVAKDLNIQVVDLFRKYQFVDSSGRNIIELESIKLNIVNKALSLNYPSKNRNKQEHYTSIVRICDEASISRDRYRKLAAINLNIVREYLVKQRRKEINNQIEQYLPISLFKIDQSLDNKTGDAVYRSIKSLLTVLVPVLTTSNPTVFYFGDIINIKIGGDSRNIGRKQSHIILAISILNEGEMVLNPKHVYSYNSLNYIYQKFAQKLQELKDNGFPVEFFLTGDWKYLALALGFNAANSIYFCLFCNCHESQRADMELNWNNGLNTCGCKHPMLFDIINEGNCIPDELHTISWTWTSLMGPDKLKVLQSFQIAKFFNQDRGKNVEYLWREFYRLYKIMCQQHLTNIEIDLFKNKARQWVKDFSRPTIGKLNSPNQQREMYPKKNITPYIHMLTQHIPKFIRSLKNKGLLLRLFSTSSLEKKNHEHIRLFFSGTTMGSGKNHMPAIYNIMVYENRQIYYRIYNTPTTYSHKVIQIKDK